MPFPSAFSYLGGMLCVTIFLLTALAAIAVWTITPSHDASPSRSQRYRIRIVTIIPVLTGLGWLFLIQRTIRYYAALRFVPSTVVAMRVARLEDEHSLPAGPWIELTDHQLLSTGFSLLAGASAHLRNHEGFTDGYYLDLRVEGETRYTEHTMQVFRRSTRLIEPIPIVIIGNKEYTCPAFHQWFMSTIAPLV